MIKSISKVFKNMFKSISIEDLKVPFIKNSMLEKANQEIINSEKIFLKGKRNLRSWILDES